MMKVTIGLLTFMYHSRIYSRTYTTLLVHKNGYIVVSGTFMQPDFARNAKRSETIDSRGEVISKMTRSCRRMKDGYFSNALDPHLVRFSAGAPIPWNPFFPYPSFAFRFCFSFVPSDATSAFSQVTLSSLPLTVGEFFSVHLFRRSRSDCLGRYIGGLKDTIFPSFSFRSSLSAFFYLYGYFFRFLKNILNIICIA